MTLPPPPENVRLQLPTGDTLPLSVSFDQWDEQGCACWITHVPSGIGIDAIDTIMCDVFPPRAKLELVFQDEYSQSDHPTSAAVIRAHKDDDGTLQARPIPGEPMFRAFDDQKVDMLVASGARLIAAIPFVIVIALILVMMEDVSSWAVWMVVMLSYTAVAGVQLMYTTFVHPFVVLYRSFTQRRAYLRTTSMWWIVAFASVSIASGIWLTTERFL